jgi:chromosome segregation ATPase
VTSGRLSPPHANVVAQPQSASEPQEVQQLRAEVARLRAAAQTDAAEISRLNVAAQNDAKERNTLHDMICRLKTELRHALDDNRSLTDGLEERKQQMDAQSAEKEAVARESKLKSAKNLFKSMLEDAESGCGAENRSMNREHAKAGLQGHKRRQFARAHTSPASGTEKYAS